MPTSYGGDTSFTFHDVSINTGFTTLLILTGFSFTFHDVSINTSDFIDTMTFDRSLHSTMFLLIPLEYKTLAPSSVFTFHDVSINTALSAGAGGGVCFFTFHDVSINT